LNLDAKTHGTFAEIGAGEEVACWFFSVGGAAGVSLADQPLTGRALAKAFGEIEGHVVLLMDTCGAGGVLNYPSTNPNVCAMLGCKAHEETSGGERNPLHGHYADAIWNS
jgi:hypothetical protein